MVLGSMRGAARCKSFVNCALPALPHLQSLLRVWEPSRHGPSHPVTSRHLPRDMPCPSCDRGTILRGTQPSKQESTHAHPSRILYIATTLLSLHSNVGKGNLGTLLFFFCCRRNLSSVGREGGREGPLCSSSYFTCNCKRRSKGGLG